MLPGNLGELLSDSVPRLSLEADAAHRVQTHASASTLGFEELAIWLRSNQTWRVCFFGSSTVYSVAPCNIVQTTALTVADSHCYAPAAAEKQALD